MSVHSWPPGCTQPPQHHTEAHKCPHTCLCACTGTHSPNSLCLRANTYAKTYTIPKKHTLTHLGLYAMLRCPFCSAMVPMCAQAQNSWCRSALGANLAKNNETRIENESKVVLQLDLGWKARPGAYNKARTSI